MSDITIGDNDWCFKIDASDGSIQILVPKRHAYSVIELTKIELGLVHCLASLDSMLLAIMEKMSEAEAAEKTVPPEDKNETGKDPKKTFGPN